MRKKAVLPGWIVASVVVGFLATGSAQASSLSVGVQTDSLSLGINIGSPPPLVVVPGTSVSHAPSVDHNYFFYKDRYYLYHQEMWLSSRHHDGPWIVIALGQVPPPVLTVPVTYYKAPPTHWKKQGPPPWASAKGHGKHKHKTKKQKEYKD